MIFLSRLIKSYFFYILSALGISLTIKSNVGVSSFNSMNLAISNASGIKIGSVTILFNVIFLLGYMILTRFSHKIKYTIQAISVFMFGILINFFTYYLLNELSIDSYAQKLFFISFGTIISGLSVGMIINYNLITFPLESFCLALSKPTNISFIRLRYSVDIVSIIVSIALSVTYHLPLCVREGTLISMILLSASMNLTKEYFNK